MRREDRELRMPSGDSLTGFLRFRDRYQNPNGPTRSASRQVAESPAAGCAVFADPVEVRAKRR